MVWSKSGWLSDDTGWLPLVVAGGSPPSYVLAGTFSASGSGDTISTTMNVGTAAADRIIVITGASQNSPAIASATINGVSCTLDASNADSCVFSAPGIAFGSGVQTITATWTGSSFFTRGITVWVASHCASSTVIHTASNTTIASTISVVAGDLMFSANNSASATPATYSSSTQAPSNTQLLASNIGGSADWVIAATNASFSVTPQIVTGLNDYAVGTYH